MPTSSVFFGLTAMAGWGVNNLLLASLTKKVGPFKAGFLVQTSTLFPTLFLFPFFKEQVVLGIDLFLLSFLGIFGALTYLTCTKGYSQGAVSIVSPLTSTWAVITAVLSFIFLKEKVVPLKIIGIIAAVLGVVLVATDFKEIVKAKRVKLFAGAKWATLTAIGWGVNFFLLALFTQKIGWYFTNLGLRFWSALAFLGLACLTGNKLSYLLQNVPKLAWAVIAVDVLTFMIYNIGLSRGESAVIAVVASAAPLVSIVLARIFLKESISLVQKTGILLCLAGIATLSLV